jgi:hypothetical protein
MGSNDEITCRVWQLEDALASALQKRREYERETKERGYIRPFLTTHDVVEMAVREIQEKYS